MEIDQILVSVRPGETRTASTYKGQLIALSFERSGKRDRIGDIIAGRVETVTDNLQAAFIDIGDDLSGFLELPRANKSKKKSNRTEHRWCCRRQINTCPSQSVSVSCN